MYFLQHILAAKVSTTGGFWSVPAGFCSVPVLVSTNNTASVNWRLLLSVSTEVALVQIEITLEIAI